ncbi:glycerophosphodiester phosphodiesterase [Miniphocaeibacter halophilus]|uniref:Glycerophosphodiester phosphodiesterase n=1 Tax=Miniphocaeibacter halophilus TaxID=2931922 RepID=A0AC61MSL5_9FIRM|nr:glycerophosphodiester phosphodiesterase [Miniphocaeibacter halophilus]QQK08477.1 glycerophosphodiester phosphodiesterase [Miniphocaeibacter halophilus]
MTLIFAHRGSKGTHPENTLASIKEAVEIGSDGVEIDVHLSKDKELIVIHDETVDRTTDGTGAIKKMFLKEIKKLDAGSWFNPIYKNEKIPTLAEVVNLLNEMEFKGVLNIEIKTDKIRYWGIERKLAKFLKSQELSFSYIYSSFNIKSLIKINRFDKKSKKAWLIKNIDLESRNMIRFKNSDIFEGLHPNIKKLKSKDEIIKFITKKIRPWTVNNKEDMTYCFKRNLDSIITDYPKEALILRKEYNNK